MLTILFSNLCIALGQVKTEPYRFIEDIFLQIDQDSTPWKYQIGATELSFSNRYNDALDIWDKSGYKKSAATKEDSLFFKKSKKIKAENYILEQANKSEIIIINEAHHLAKHRTFTQSLLQELYNNGYKYLGIETLQDTLINKRKFAVLDSGYYTREPEFGNLIHEALTIGFTLFGYEALNGKNGTEREIEQAQNIQKFIKKHPKGKVLIYCGYAHAYENDYPHWGKAMAGRLKEIMGIDPFSIDQTLFIEKFNKEDNNIFIKLNTSNTPIVLIDNSGKVFNGTKGKEQTDVVILHPETKLINGRPHWLTQKKIKYKIPISKLANQESYLIFAYRGNEFENNGIPADIVEINTSTKHNFLYLKKGTYTIVIKNRNYTIINQYTVNIK